ncbi:hypothetical protein KKH23_03850 [Patescibacteria group bacterium]|nr:hypothetical protein [Patescibacteria group bacterium]MBU0776906.1 hypothetical protein [Patescibacteria group bacterium]MBU0846299.1 hypothetical protein [Patescibacteria group bacterium]MBU0922563.1 hypothetical protein [Patescibacteria group bacterium]MBU1066556.1 hypothetical protein [Patescibacteria group bacterium]
MSNRGSDWVGYANLGANIVQAGQLSRVQRNLEGLALIEIAREERVRLENELRQYIFETEEGLKRLRKYIDKAPLGVFTVTSQLDSFFREIRLEPEAFQQFVDKDRVQSLFRSVEEIFEETSKFLDQNVMEEVRSKVELVQKLLGYLKILPKLTETTNEDKKLEKKRAFVITMLLGVAIFTLIAFGFDTPGNCICGGSGVVYLAILMFALAKGPYGDKKRGVRIKQLEELQKQVSLLAKEINSIAGKELTEKKEYEQVLDEAQTRLKMLTQEDKDGEQFVESLSTILFQPQFSKTAQDE